MVKGAIKVYFFHRQTNDIKDRTLDRRILYVSSWTEVRAKVPKLTWSIAPLDIMTNTWTGKPSAFPLGTNMFCGQPQPQKLNDAAAASELAAGLFLSRFRYVTSCGMVTDELRHRRVISFLPLFTAPETLELTHTHIHVTVFKEFFKNSNSIK